MSTAGPGEALGTADCRTTGEDGYATACGHGTIALGVWAVDEGLVEAGEDNIADVTIDGSPHRRPPDADRPPNS